MITFIQIHVIITTVIFLYFLLDIVAHKAYDLFIDPVTNEPDPKSIASFFITVFFWEISITVLIGMELSKWLKK